MSALRNGARPGVKYLLEQRCLSLQLRRIQDVVVAHKRRPNLGLVFHDGRRAVSVHGWGGDGARD